MQAVLLAGAAVLALAACGEREAEKAAASPDVATPTTGTTAAGTRSAPAREVMPETRTFRDWTVVCDNGLACVAFGGGDTGGWLRIGIAPGPDATPTIKLGPGPFAEEGPGRIALVVDGRRHAAAASGDDGDYNVSIPQAQARAILAELAKATSVSLAGVDQTQAISPDGISAALLWIDEKQGRLDTTTALIRRGARPASAVPAPPALPRITAAPPSAQTGFEHGQDPLQDSEDGDLVLPAALKAVPAVARCIRNTADQPFLAKSILAARLGPQKELWGVPCDSGAYNVSYLMYVTGPGGSNPRAAVLPTWDPRNAAAAPTEGDDDTLTNPSYDPATRTLTHFPRGRGVGDCGIIQSWTWTGDGFALKQEQVMGECQGMISDLWPTTWRTRAD